MTDKCPYCQTEIELKMVEGADWEWCTNNDCEYKTDIYYYPNSDEIRNITEVAPEGSVLLVAEDGTVEGSGHFDEETIHEGIKQTDGKYVIECEETRSFEMVIGDANKIKNIQQENVDRVIQNA